MKFLLSASALASIVAPALGATYSRSDSIVGADFFRAFTFVVEADPTHGRVYLLLPISILVFAFLMMLRLQQLCRPGHGSERRSSLWHLDHLQNGRRPQNGA